eukprot:921524-Prymnesium_polylepis.3
MQLLTPPPAVLFSPKYGSRSKLGPNVLSSVPTARAAYEKPSWCARIAGQLPQRTPCPAARDRPIEMIAPADAALRCPASFAASSCAPRGRRRPRSVMPPRFASVRLTMCTRCSMLGSRPVT